MTFSKELKVGIAIVATIIIFVLGIRYFEDIPLFQGTYSLTSEFDDARGMIVGNEVRISGVKVGSIQRVALNPGTNKVAIEMRINQGIVVTEGAYAEITGFDALNAVQLVIHPGPPAAPPLTNGSTIPNKSGSDLLNSLSDQAPVLIERVDSVLVGLDATLGDTRTLMQPGGDVQELLASLRNSAETLQSVMQGEKERLSRVMMNVESTTGNLNAITASAGDSLNYTLAQLNSMLVRLDTSLAELEGTTTTLNSILNKIDQGQGTLGLMVNDPGLYHRLDSTVHNMNNLLIDFQEHPVRYMRALRLFDVF